MKNRTKVWLIVAASLVVIGAVIFCGVMAALEWDFSKLATEKYETNSYETNESYRNISVVSDIADIVFVPCEGDKTSVVCYERENCKHSIGVNDGTLEIKLSDTRKWYEHIGIFDFETPKITVYIPKKEYSALSVKASTGAVDIPSGLNFERIGVTLTTGKVKSQASASELLQLKTTTGYVSVENVSLKDADISTTTGIVSLSNVTCGGDVRIKVTTGKVNVSDLTCEGFSSSGNTGDVVLKNVVASEKLSVERSTGDVRFEACDAAEIFVKTNTGNVKGSLLTEKIFFARSDTGRIDIPKSTTGGKCEITTDTGNIKIEIVNQ